MTESQNRMTELLGDVDGNSAAAVRAALGRSPFNPANVGFGSAPVRNTLFSHFNAGATIPLGFTLTADGTAVAAATYGTGLGGTAVITSDDVAAAAHSLTSTALQWQADRQATGDPIVFECKVKVGTLAAREFFFGITDAVADANPIALSVTSTFTTSTPDDFALIGYSDTPTSGAAFTTGGNQHVAISGLATVNSVVAVGGGAFATAVYYTYRIELDPNGTARFYVNGALIATKTTALTTTVPLGLLATAIPRTTAGSGEAVMTIDYIGISGT